MDLFENYEELPQEVRNILDDFWFAENDYDTCMDLVTELNAVGYTCDYGLNAEPYGLRKLTEFDKWSVEQVDKVFDYMLDDMHPLDMVKVRNEVTTTNEKIVYLIEQEEKYKNSFK